MGEAEARQTSPAAVVDAVYAARAAGDLEALVSLFHPDVVVEQDPALPWGGVHRGLEGLATFGATLRAAIDSEVTVERSFVAGEDVVIVGRTAGTVRRTGVAFDVPVVHVWTVRDGRVVAARYLIDSAAMLEALGVAP